MEIDVFRRKVSQPAAEKSSRLLSKANFTKLIYYITAFLVTRPAILGGMMPFGIALFAAEYTASPPFVIGAMMLISAGLVSGNALVIVKYTAAAVLFTALSVKFPTLLKSPIRRGALMTVCIVSASFMILAGNTVLVYDFLITAVEGALVFGLTVLFANAKNIIFTGKISSGSTGEDLISVSVLAAAVILGAGSGFSIMGINISQVLCVTASLIFSYTGGAGAGAIAGIAIGLTAGIADGEIASVLGAFAISSLSAGFFSKYGKAACLLSFIITNSLITLYTGGSAEAVINLYGIFTAGAIFMLLPASVINKFSPCAVRGMKASPSRTGNLLSHELSVLSASLADVAGTFEHISDEKLLGTGASASVFFDRTIKTACDGCPRSHLCWKKEFHRTYTSLFVMLQICEKNGSLKVSNLPQGMSEKCLSVNKLVNTFNNMYDIYKVDKLWESRIIEARAMVVRQLMSISRTIEQSSENVKRNVSFDSNAEGAVAVSLYEAGMPARSVCVSQTDARRCVDIELREGVTPLNDVIRETVSAKLGESMRIIRQQGNHLRLIPGGVLDIKVGSAETSKETENGDTFGHIYTPDGKCLLVLSDGMGSGEKAKMNSRAVVTMLGHMLSAGFDIDTAISMINSVLVLKSTDTSFATVDIVLIDPVLCTAEFIKIGAASSYLKQSDKVRVISSSGLPAGVSQQPDSEKVRCKLYDKSSVVLISDGISDADPGGDKWIVEMVGNYDGDNPDELADAILTYARQKYGDSIRDDMTVAAAIVNNKKQIG